MNINNNNKKFKNLNEIKSFEYWNVFDVSFMAGWHKEDREYVYQRFLKWVQHYNKEVKLLAKQINKLDNKVRFSHSVLPSTRRLYNNLLMRFDLNSYLRHKIIEEYDYYLYRRYHDQTVFDQKKNRYFDPYKTNMKLDLMTRPGVDRTNHIIVNESRSYFAFAALGKGTALARASDETLGEEIIRVPIATTGSISALGDSMRVFVIFPNGIESGLYSEHAVFDSITGGVMWFKVVYPNDRLLDHTQNETFPTTSHYIYTRPI